jgi:hypothetical protein
MKNECEMGDRLQTLHSEGESGRLPIQVTHPKQHDDILLNPGMGVLLVQRRPPKIKFNELPLNPWFIREGLSDKILFQIPWSVLEPEQGQYQWDHPEWEECFQTWVDAGFSVALQIRGMCSLGTLYNDGTPQWVFNLGAKYVDHDPEFYKTFGTYRAVDARPIRHPVYWDPIYLECASATIAAFGKRYNGRSEIEFVQTGHMGLWGEMHISMHPDYQEWLKAGFTVARYTEAFKHLLDLYAAAFPDTQCIQEIGSPSYRIPGITWRDSEECIRYAVERGFGIKMCGFGEENTTGEVWRDPCCQDWVADVYKSAYTQVKVAHENYGILLPEKFHTAINRHHGSYWNRGGESGGLVELHILQPELFTEYDNRIASQLSIEERKNMYRYIARHVGYRLIIEEIIYPKSIQCGKELSITSTWRNIGAAPCYEKLMLTIALHDELGRVVWQQNSISETPINVVLWDSQAMIKNISNWLIDDQQICGRYRLSVALIQARYPHKSISLGIVGELEKNRYWIGEIEIEK